MEIEQRLGLYQVFLKLYKHHRSLLDEILQLEKTSNKTFSNLTTRCVTGIIQGQQVYLVTNLADGKTQTLFQPQRIWTIGRERQLAISIPDRRLSRRHAVIQYIQNQGFYLVDLESTNGSFVNGEPVHGRLPIKDGDRIRLSSLAFSFFLCDDSQTLDDTPSDILAQLKAATVTPTLTTVQDLTSVQETTAPASPEDRDIPIPITPTTEQVEQKEETSHFLQQLDDLEEPAVASFIAQLSPAQQSEILDRFFSRQIQKVIHQN
ncbi:MAG TPA: FHA domain-containing protein [Coleofasciculaceae cyanobacterium]|jgi:pSer/pThr/pTyr-binding forkhead associated (FHA) protein